METNELYTKLICMLTHDLEICDNCKKCGNTGVEARLQTIRELAEIFQMELPWKE